MPVSAGSEGLRFRSGGTDLLSSATGPQAPQESRFVPTKRVSILANMHRDRSKVVLLPETLEELLLMGSQVLDLEATTVYNRNGVVVDDIELVRDDDTLFLSSGEPFSYARFGSSGSIHRAGSSNSMVGAIGAGSDSSSSVLGGGPSALDMPPPPGSDGAKWISLNVGGTIFRTTRETLMRDPDSMLCALISRGEAFTNVLDDSGAVLIDRSPEYFRPLLNYLRTDALVLDSGLSPVGVYNEARFYGLWGAAEQLEPRVRAHQRAERTGAPLTRADLTRVLLVTSSGTSLRCQGLNFAGADLSKLDLAHVNFKYANLSRCNLSQCDLRHCNFTGANMRAVKLDGAHLMGCNFARATLDRASARACNFDDPSQRSTTTLEGACIKDANLEDSNLDGANLRAASLKGTSLLNCNLRRTNFAGADLGNCDLTGCNLQGANLRGANTLGALFHRIPTAVHMSQSVLGHVRAEPMETRD